MSIKVYLTKANKWRWKRLFENGKTNYDSVRSFPTQDDAQASVDAARQEMAMEWDGSEDAITLAALAKRAKEDRGIGDSVPDSTIERDLQALTHGKGWQFVDGELTATATFGELVLSAYSTRAQLTDTDAEAQRIYGLFNERGTEIEARIAETRAMQETLDRNAALISEQEGIITEQKREIARLEQWGSRSFIKRLLRR